MLTFFNEKSGNGREKLEKGWTFCVTTTPYSFFHSVEKGTFYNGNERGMNKTWRSVAEGEGAEVEEAVAVGRCGIICTTESVFKPLVVFLRFSLIFFSFFFSIIFYFLLPPKN